MTWVPLGVLFYDGSDLARNWCCFCGTLNSTKLHLHQHQELFLNKSGKLHTPLKSACGEPNGESLEIQKWICS